MKRVAISLTVVSLLAACGGGGRGHRPSTTLAPSNHHSDPMPPSIPTDPWLAPEVMRINERLLAIQTPFGRAWNELSIDQAAAGKSSVDFFFEAPTEGTLRIQDFRVEGQGCVQEDATQTALQLVSSGGERKDIKPNETLNLEPRAYRIRIGIDNAGACQSFKLRFRAPWEGPQSTDSVDNYQIPPAPPLRQPLPSDGVENPMLKPIENTDAGSLGACLRQQIELQAPPEGRDIQLFQGQPIRDDADPSIAEYTYFTRHAGSDGQANRKFQLKLSTSDGQAWRFIYDGFKATAYASGLSLKAHAVEAGTGDLNFGLDLSSCKELIPKINTSRL